jgi:gamma-glutamylcyclotransferase (GGCT)/AIG2-like uncharacterized protein YtfP
MVKYFAYGSNLDQRQMTQRCPGAKIIGAALLSNHRLCFPRRSPVRGCAVASFEPHKGGTIWGVIYELDDNDLKRLDEREGYDPINVSAVNRYCRVDVSVRRNPGGAEDVVTYVAIPEDDPGLPSADYLKHIIDGAVFHNFPKDYIENLRAIAVVEAEDAFMSIDWLTLRTVAMEDDE